MNDRGFVRATFMEGMIIGAVVLIAAAIILPYFLNFKERDYEEQAETHARQIYTISQTLFDRNPGARADIAQISSYGYQGSPDIQVTVEGGRSDIVITAKHMKGGRAVRIDHKGEVSRL